MYLPCRPLATWLSVWLVMGHLELFSRFVAGHQYYLVSRCVNSCIHLFGNGWCNNFLEWSFIGQVSWNRRDGSYKKGSSRQKIQEPWAANDAGSWPPKCCGFKALFFLKDWEGGALPQLSSWVCTGDCSSCHQTLQQDEPTNALDICKTVHVPGKVYGFSHQNLLIYSSTTLRWP